MKLTRKDTNIREAIPAGERLAVTLRFLATGKSYSSLHYQFRISISSISLIVPEVCQAVFDALKEEFQHFPENEEEWLAIAAGFEDVWQLPHCVGAADGKHVRILHPHNSGSVFYNYKGYYSIVLMAVVDANYNFIFADVGCQGRISDSGVMRNTLFWSKLVNGKLNLPKPKPLPSSPSLFHPDSNIPIPYFFAGDDAFPLETNVMKPFAQRGLSEERRIFNYRLSWGRRVSESVFGILSNRFRVYSTVLSIKLDNAVKVILATLALHNFLRAKVPNRYIPKGSVDEDHLGKTRDGSWRVDDAGSNLASFPNSRKGRPAVKAEEMREILCEHFNGPGQVPWQWNTLI
ncbi:uncharacterized protein LOC114518686 [Dendronephthya gigantea]|uniref:uncharacterized protein LOC114518686 n=1 Tax=Dendronephthya gigantea TaxID=151771 RepID=UPI001068F859|nr:uncharacterized protein LOC114518686 [Dendronephthya gigantea]